MGATVNGGRLARIECIDFVGMTKLHIEEAFRRFFDPKAAKTLSGRQEQIRTLGGHGNGGKFYMRQMFKTSQAICYRNGRVNVFAFNERKQYGYEAGYEDRKMSLLDALKLAELTDVFLPKKIQAALDGGKAGYTVVQGNQPVRVAAAAPGLASGPAHQRTPREEIVVGKAATNTDAIRNYRPSSFPSKTKIRSIPEHNSSVTRGIRQFTAAFRTSLLASIG